MVELARVQEDQNSANSSKHRYVFLTKIYLKSCWNGAQLKYHEAAIILKEGGWIFDIIVNSAGLHQGNTNEQRLLACGGTNRAQVIKQFDKCFPTAVFVPQ